MFPEQAFPTLLSLSRSAPMLDRLGYLRLHQAGDK